ncbi:merozoite surface antigen 2 [Reticulomyxa filosa]|uniref:Merozoite surface antigen 2 n=1 Tax=Reticulomyxa filosa TaxID=46433 RepID=X6N3H6_RETFI|nr:merozoite surface antigen 2 [Reticulomyxa filosa]|eukprot:ETO20631.1 merozoite surface antigen 2 [Reticulomyxa filosa]
MLFCFFILSTIFPENKTTKKILRPESKKKPSWDTKRSTWEQKKKKGVKHRNETKQNETHTEKKKIANGLATTDVLTTTTFDALTTTTDNIELTTTTTTNTATTKWYTTNPLIVQMLEAAMNYTYDLPENVYEWNLTRIEIAVSTHNPTFWTMLNPCLLVVSLPADVLSQLPVQMLIYYHLCYLIPKTNTTSTPSNVTCVPQDPCAIDYCVKPLQTSKFQPNLISKYGQQDVSKNSNDNASIPGVEMHTNLSQCGLRCDQGWQLLGITPKHQVGIDVAKIICLALSICGLLFLFYNQYHDQINSNETFGKKSLLYQLPYFITLAVFVLFCFFF